jgi:hypothetical protein
MDPMDTTAQVVSVFRDSLTQYISFPKKESEVPTVGIRRSPRRRTPSAKKEGQDASSPSLSQEEPSPRRGRKRAGEHGDRRNTSGRSSNKKAKRTYAAPETYSHLENLPDHLLEKLDGMLFK